MITYSFDCQLKQHNKAIEEKERGDLRYCQWEEAMGEKAKEMNDFVRFLVDMYRRPGVDKDESEQDGSSDALELVMVKFFYKKQ